MNKTFSIGSGHENKISCLNDVRMENLYPKKNKVEEISQDQCLKFINKTRCWIKIKLIALRTQFVPRVTACVVG